MKIYHKSLDVAIHKLGAVDEDMAGCVERATCPSRMVEIRLEHLRMMKWTSRLNE